MVIPITSISVDRFLHTTNFYVDLLIRQLLFLCLFIILIKCIIHLYIIGPLVQDRCIRPCLTPTRRRVTADPNPSVNYGAPCIQLETLPRLGRINNSNNDDDNNNLTVTIVRFQNYYSTAGLLNKVCTRVIVINCFRNRPTTWPFGAPFRGTFESREPHTKS